MGIYRSALILGRGIGQVMFQNNALSGALMLAGIALHSWLLAVLTVAGTTVGTLTAWWSGYDREDIQAGLYGFNGALVGVAVGIFMPVNVASMVLLVVGAALSTWVAYGMRRAIRLPGMTAPFILVVWLLLIACRLWCPSLLLPAAPQEAVVEADVFRAFSLNIGQVMFQGHILAGVCFLLGILVNSRLQAAYTVAGAGLPLLLWLCPWIDPNAWQLGLLGYNGVLCALALGDKTWSGAWQALVAVLLSVGLQLLGLQLGVVTLTAPFVLSVWMVKVLSRPSR